MQLTRVLFPAKQQGPREQPLNSTSGDAPSSAPVSAGTPPAGTLKGKVLPLLLSAPCVPQAALDLLCRSCGLAEDQSTPGAPGGATPGAPGAAGEPAAGSGAAPAAAGAAGGAAAQGAAGKGGAAQGTAKGAREDGEGEKLLTEGLAVLWRVLRLRPPLRTPCLDLILQVSATMPLAATQYDHYSTALYTFWCVCCFTSSGLAWACLMSVAVCACCLLSCPAPAVLHAQTEQSEEKSHPFGECKRPQPWLPSLGYCDWGLGFRALCVVHLIPARSH